MRAREAAVIAVIALAAAGCASQRAAVDMSQDYQELVQLRGAAVTMLEHHQISVDEARMVKVMLNAARRAADAGQDSMARTELDAIRAYLRSRQGQPL